MIQFGRRGRRSAGPGAVGSGTGDAVDTRPSGSDPAEAVRAESIGSVPAGSSDLTPTGSVPVDGRGTVSTGSVTGSRSTGAGDAPAVRVRGLTKTFGTFTAVDDLSFEVARGEVFGIVGPNGSGKTTTIRMLTGTLLPTAGSIEVLGTDMARRAASVQPRIGYMSQRFSLFEDLTVEENLRFYGGVYGLDAATFAERRDYVLDMAGLRGREGELTANLSTGWKQRLALGTGTIHSPELLFLDEPTSGVDPVARRRFWDLLYDLAASGVTLFVTTHYMDEATNCSRLALMYRGRIVADGTPRAVRAAAASPGNPDPSLEDAFVRLIGAEGG